MDPPVVCTESRCDMIFFAKICTKTEFAGVILMQTWSYDDFRKARHLRGTTNANNGHLNPFKMASVVILYTPQTQIFRSKTDLV